LTAPLLQCNGDYYTPRDDVNFNFTAGEENMVARATNKHRETFVDAMLGRIPPFFNENKLRTG